MQPIASKTLCAAAVLLALLALGVAATGSPDPGGDVREIGRTTERELKVVLTASFGSVAVGRGEPEKVLMAEGVEHNGGVSPMDITYEVRNRVGYLDMSLGAREANHEDGKTTKTKTKTKSGLDISGGEWRLRFSDAVPLSVDMELGVGNGTIDMTGLQVRDFSLETGASDVTLIFDAPNLAQMENMSIESGVSRFVGRNLGNANFRRLRFSGGMGSYELDFGGDLTGEVDVDISLGVGVMTVIVPGDIGASVQYEKSWTSKITYDGDFRTTDGSRTQTGNYATAKGKMNIRIESGMGSVKVRRR